MSVTLNPYLNFRGNARQAMEFYHGVFGGKLNVGTFADLHAAQDPAEESLVMHADLEGDNGLRLMGSDIPPRMQHEPGTNNFSVSLSGDSEAQLRGFFDKLADQGEVDMPLTTASWGDTFGMCTDRFGVHWLVNVAAPKAAPVG